MKLSVRLLLLTVFLWTSGAWAAGEDPLFSQETESIESILEPAQVSADRKIRIILDNGKAFEFDTLPKAEEMRETLGLNMPEKIKKQILERGGSLEEVNPLEAFESLDPSQRERFQRLRISFLSNAARVLNSTKFVFGAGTLVGDAFRFVKLKTQKAFGKNIDAGPTVQRSFQMRSQESVQNILRGLDYKLFSQAPLVIDSNEYGVSASVGLVAESGVLRKGGGGAEEIGLSLAYNKTKRAFVFEIFHNSENFDNTKAAVTVVGVVGKIGPTIARRQGAETLKGSSFYPPAAPMFSSASPEFFVAGASSSLGFPPPPLADLMTFTNKFERNALIRVTVSPLVKGYVRLEFGSFAGSLRLVTMRFVGVYEAISSKIHSLRAPSCGGVFLVTNS